MGFRSHFTRSPPAIHQVELSRDDLDSEISGTDFATYTVQIPPTPDNQPLQTSTPGPSQGVNDQYASGSLFTGGHDRATRAHSKDKVVESSSGTKGSSVCQMLGCDARAMRDENGREIVPCGCDFKICRECYQDAMRTTDGICPGCREPYEVDDDDDDGEDMMEPRKALPSSISMSKVERRLSLAKSSGNLTHKEFDHNQWLFETKGSYGYGNVMWPTEDGKEVRETLKDKQWRPLTRDLRVSAAILSPYR